MDLFDYIQKRKNEISTYIDFALKEKAKDTDREYVHLYDSLREFSTKGKHLRGCFFLLSYEMAGGKNVEQLMPAAAAIEINGSALLIHDDIMDNDMLRRGGPSMFAQYIEKGKEISAISPQHYGVSAGILIGNIALMLGFELLNRAGIDSDYKSEVYKRYAQDMQITAVGQMMDFDVGNTTREPNEEEILKIYKLKTAQYSLVNPFIMGAQAAGAPDEYRSALLDVCTTLGIIFQIKDDMVGLLGNEEETGKAARSDVRENKKTLIRKYLFDATQGDDKELLTRVFGSDTISDKDFATLVSLIHSTGVDKKIDQKMQGMAETVLEKIKLLHLDERYASLMKELVTYSLSRSK